MSPSRDLSVDPDDGHLVDRGEREEVVDPDVDLHDPAQLQETRPRQWDLLLVTAVGGALGAAGRYELGLAVPHPASAFPWSTLIVNATGCLSIGALMVVLLELTSPHRLVRPFLGVGILGGYTTFSTFTVDVQRLVSAHRPLVALADTVTMVVVCAGAVWLSTAATRALGRAVVHRRRGDGDA